MPSPLHHASAALDSVRLGVVSPCFPHSLRATRFAACGGRITVEEGEVEAWRRASDKESCAFLLGAAQCTFDSSSACRGIARRGMT